MKIVGYCTLWAIAFALLIAMCIIVSAGHVAKDGAPDSDVAASKVTGHGTPGLPAAKPIAHAALPSA